MAIKHNFLGPVLTIGCALLLMMLLFVGGVAVALGGFFLVLLGWLVLEVINLGQQVPR